MTRNREEKTNTELNQTNNQQCLTVSATQQDTDYNLFQTNQQNIGQEYNELWFMEKSM